MKAFLSDVGVGVRALLTIGMVVLATVGAVAVWLGISGWLGVITMPTGVHGALVNIIHGVVVAVPVLWVVSELWRLRKPTR